MRLLLDSQVILWALTNPPRLSSRAQQEILDARNTTYSSAATPYELGWKHTIGKLAALPITANWTNTLNRFGYMELPITVAHAERAAALPAHHRDPWDRILMGQALVENMTIISSDRTFPTYGVPVIW